MAEQNSKKKTNTKKNNTTKKGNTKKVNATSKKEVKKVAPKEEIKIEQIVEEKVSTPVVKEKKKFELTSKQRDTLLIVLTGVLLLIALILTGSKEPKLNIELPIALEGEVGFNEITYAEYEEKLNTEDPFVVVIVNDGCGYCDLYKPVVEKVANEYKLPISYINLANITSEEYNSLAKSNSYLKKEQWGTPTTLFLYGDKVVDYLGGYKEEDAFREFVLENFVVNNNE